MADSKGLPKVEKITEKMSKRWGPSTVVIPAPKDVDEVMRKGIEASLYRLLPNRFHKRNLMKGL